MTYVDSTDSGSTNNNVRPTISGNIITFGAGGSNLSSAINGPCVNTIIEGVDTTQLNYTFNVS